MSTTIKHNDNLMRFADSIPVSNQKLEAQSFWNILVIDDDEHVHATTRIVLGSLRIQDRPLKLFEARSAAEAKILLHKIEDLSVILLDVVMESENAGLLLVDYIRNEWRNSEVRIILRTGQPGQAPEQQVVDRYDINDYKSKAELTHNRLVTSLTSAIRAYQQIRTINHNRLSLEEIIKSTSGLLELRSPDIFSRTVLHQFEALLGFSIDGFVAITPQYEHSHYWVTGGSGRFKPWANKPLSAEDYPEIASLLLQAVKSHHHVKSDTAMVLYLPNGQQAGFVYLDKVQHISAADIQLIEVFASNLAVSYQNLTLIQKLEFTAYYDPLTSLPNRSQFLRVLDQANQDGPGNFMVCLLDLSHFADINDGLGQDLGNVLLVAVATRLKSRLMECSVARIAADVFGIYGPQHLVCPDLLLDLFQAPFQVGDHNLPLSVTLGFCKPLQNNEPGSWLLKYANIALNLAKKNLREPFEYFTDKMEEQVRWRLETISHLRLAFRTKKLELWYQPQICTKSARCCGLEALLRWPDANAGFIPPATFIPLAEYSGLIIDIGYWIVEEACQTLGSLAKAGINDITIAVNISILQFRSPTFIARVMAILSRYNISPEKIEIEITEGLVMDEPKIVIESLETLRRSGFKVAIDDFGTGYSSLSYLQNLPIDKLKIDKSFVDRLDSPQGEAIVTAIASLCQTLGLKTVAEGVETALQLSVVQALSCDLVQGFYYAQAMNLENLLPWLQNYHHKE